MWLPEDSILIPLEMAQNVIPGLVENLSLSAPVLEGRGRVIQEKEYNLRSVV